MIAAAATHRRAEESAARAASSLGSPACTGNVRTIHSSHHGQNSSNSMNASSHSTSQRHSPDTPATATNNNANGLDDTLKTSNSKFQSFLTTGGANKQQSPTAAAATSNATTTTASMEDWSHRTIPFDDPEKGKVRVTSLIDGFLRFRRHRSESSTVDDASNSSHAQHHHHPKRDSSNNSNAPPRSATIGAKRASFQHQKESGQKLNQSQQSMSSIGSRSTIGSGGNRPRQNSFNTMEDDASARSTGSIRQRSASMRRRVSFHDLSQPHLQPTQRNPAVDDSISHLDFNNSANTRHGMDESWHVQLDTSATNDNASSNMDASWHVQLDKSSDNNNNDNHDFDASQPPPTPPPPQQQQLPKWFEKYMPHWLLYIRSVCGTIVLDERFQVLIIALIIINAVILGLDTFDFVDMNPEVQRAFDAVNMGFLIIFTIELALQFGYWGYQLFFHGWLVFDFTTIMLSWLFDGVQVFRCFRVFRSFRLIVRIPILRSLVHAVIHVLPRITSIMGLFVLVLYIYAVMTTELWSDLYERGITDIDYFGRLDYSAFTLFQFVTLEGWGDVVRQVAAEYYWAWFVLDSFLVITGFILYSLVIAVVCDSFLIAEAQFRAEMKAKNKHKKLKRKKNASEKLQEELDSLLPPPQQRRKPPVTTPSLAGSSCEGLASNSRPMKAANLPIQDRIRTVQQDLFTLGGKQEEILKCLQDLVEQLDRPEDLPLHG